MNHREDPVITEHHIIIKALSRDTWECSCGAEVVGDFQIMDLVWDIHHPASDGDHYWLQMETTPKPGMEIDLATATFQKKMTEEERAAYKEWLFGPGWSEKIAALRRAAS